MPFVALIIGPYSVKNKNDSLIKIFHLKKNVPYNLAFKNVPSTKLRKAMITELKDLFTKYKINIDKINLKEKWTSNMSREAKLIKSL